MQEYRLTGADRPNVPIPSLEWVDRVWRNRMLVIAVLMGLAAIAGISYGQRLTQVLGAWDAHVSWASLLPGVVALLAAVVTAMKRVDQVPRVGMMEERSTSAKGVRASVKTEQLPSNLQMLRVQDYMAVEMVQYAWPMLPALVGMVLVLIALWTVTPAVVIALILVAVWAGIRLNSTLIARRYYRLRRQ